MDDAINDLVDRLSPVPPALLKSEDTVVRLFLTLPRGAETISTTTVQRLAAVNATIWIDA